jgi:transposase-like protein
VASRSWVKAHSPYWSLHVEAWRQSGMARADYCRQHGLSTKTFERWMKHLISKEEAREHAKSLQDSRRREQRRQQGKSGKRSQRPRYSVRTDTRSRALQAFWAMHVEAMNWAGMGVREYAASLRLSPYALRKWRDRIENAEVEIDWRAHLHPSARPQTSTGASSAAKDCSPENDLTAAREADPPHDGRSNRRSFTNEEKLAVVLESEQPGMSVAEVCAAIASSRAWCSAGASSSALRARRLRSWQRLRSREVALEDRPPPRCCTICCVPRTG